MRFVVIGQVLLGTRDGNAAVGALVADVCRRESTGAILAVLGVVRRGGRASGLVVGVWAVGILTDEGSALADSRRRGVGEGVEEIVGFEERLRVGIAPAVVGTRVRRYF